MFEELYKELSAEQVTGYLERLEVTENATLDELIYAHQTHIPFETMDMSLLGIPANINTDALFDKLITRKRGGYCFELNGLFTRLLNALGYETESYLARAVVRRDWLPEPMHRLPVVKLNDTLLLADVGYGGPMSCKAIPLIEGEHEDGTGECFVLAIDRASFEANGASPSDPGIPGAWRLLRKTPKGLEKLLLFEPYPQFEVDFLPSNYYCSTHPESFFVINKIVNLRTANGSKTFFNDTLKLVTDGQLTQQEGIAREDIPKVIQENFGLTLQ